MEARLCLPLSDAIDPQIIIGHGHITGPAAAARAAAYHKSARRIHFLHTMPEELEWYKAREEADPAERAQRKQHVEAVVALSGTLAVAVGPRLTRHWRNHMDGLKGGGVQIHRLNPGLPAAEPVDGPPAGIECLVLGRIEDMRIKGADIAAAAMGVIAKDGRFRGAKEPTLVVRGAKPRTSEGLHSILTGYAETGILLKIKEFTQDAERVREDIARASVVVMPSRVEGFGLVGLEALAMGVPVLISKRSGLGELLLERIDADSSLGFASKYVIDVQDHLATDAEQWAIAIKTVLQDRQAAFRETAMLRDALQRSEYWPRAVSELIQALDKPAEPLPIPAGDKTDQLRRAVEFARRDPSVSVAISTDVLEQTIEEAALSRGTAKPGLRSEQYLALLAEKGVLTRADVDIIKKLYHQRNMLIHDAYVGMDHNMAEDHVRSVEHVIQSLKPLMTTGALGVGPVNPESLKPSMTIGSLSIGPVNPGFGATGCFYIEVRNGPVPLWPTLKISDFSEGTLNETPFTAHWRGPVSPHFLFEGEPQQLGLLGIASLAGQNPLLFVWAQGDFRIPVTRDLPLERQEPVEFVVTFYGRYTVIARRTGDRDYEEERIFAKRKYRVAPDTSDQVQFRYRVVSEEVLPD
jgi:glycosyltransferase involved in cell wall biosynthesis